MFPCCMQGSEQSLHSAALWDYVRLKLWDLGRLCGLLPHQAATTSAQLHQVVSGNEASFYFASRNGFRHLN